MKAVLLLLAGAVLAWSQDSVSTKDALTVIKKAGGKTIFDEGRPDRPLIGVDI